MGETDLGKLLSAVGNHEAKALLLIAMREGTVYSARALHRLLLGHQGGPVTWRPNVMVPFDYCNHSLGPIGAVAEEVIDATLGTYGYVKTPYGREFGDALAGHLLAFSEAQDLPLRHLFGNTNTVTHAADDAGEAETAVYTKRSPYRRYRIFVALLRAELPVRELDLVYALGERDAMLGPHLQNLGRRGVISYRTKHLGESYVVYRLRRHDPAEPLSLDPRNRLLTEQVLAILRENVDRALTRHQGYEALICAYPQRKREKEYSLKTSISKVLSHLERGGSVERGRFRPAVQSEVDLTDAQRARLARLVAVCESFARLDHSFLEEGRAKADAIVNDPGRVRALLQKARDASPDVNRTESKALAELVLSLLYQWPHSTISELRDHLAEQYDTDVTTDRVKQILALLRAQGSVAAASNGRPLRYVVAGRGSGG